MNIHSDTACGFRNDGALLQRFIDPVDAVVLHGQQEAAKDIKYSYHIIVQKEYETWVKSNLES